MQNAPAFRLQSTKTERQVRVCEFQNRKVSTILWQVIGFRPKYDAPVFWPERGNSVHLQQAPTLYPQKMQRTFAVLAHFLQRTLQMPLNRCKDHFRFIFLLNSFSVWICQRLLRVMERKIREQKKSTRKIFGIQNFSPF